MSNIPSSYGMQPAEQQVPQGLEIPNITQEYLDKLSEEELQQLLQHQQQLMLL